MAKNKRLQELEKLIFFGDHTDGEWRQIADETQKEFEKASEKEKEAFVRSGAGSLITQIMEYMD